MLEEFSASLMLLEKGNSFPFVRFSPNEVLEALVEIGLPGICSTATGAELSDYRWRRRSNAVHYLLRDIHFRAYIDFVSQMARVYDSEIPLITYPESVGKAGGMYSILPDTMCYAYRLIDPTLYHNQLCAAAHNARRYSETHAITDDMHRLVIPYSVNDDKRLPMPIPVGFLTSLVGMLARWKSVLNV